MKIIFKSLYVAYSVGDESRALIISDVDVFIFVAYDSFVIHHTE